LSSNKMGRDNRDIVLYCKVDHLLHFSRRRIPKPIARNAQRYA
jgi:hypothetical protein